ncbi:MAG: hypothetical protein GW946_02490 [Candidatus Pacebacteria bacterium]|nr:hypothetical protein [Candidatus Paceibacterota bacterium]
MERYVKWYGEKPETPGEHDLVSLARFVPGLLAELRLFGESSGRQLQELFAVVSLGAIELFAAVREQDAAQRLRALFGEPHPDLETAVPVAVQLHSDEAVAVDIAREQQFSVEQFVEKFMQAAVQEFLRLQAGLVAIEARIEAKKQAVKQTNTMQLHVEAQADKGAFINFTDKRLQELLQKKRELEVQIAVLSRAFSQIAGPLLHTAQELSRQLFVSKLDASQAIPVGPIDVQPD